MKFYQTEKFNRIISKINRASKLFGIKYAMDGGNAIDYYCNPPKTMDIDILVMGDRIQFEKFISALMSQGIKINEIPYDEFDFTMLFMKDKKERVEVDVRYSTCDHLHIQAIKNSVKRHKFHIVKPEYLVVMKLLAYQGRRLKKDLIGASELLKNQYYKMDKELLFYWLRGEKLTSLFNLVLKTTK